MATTFVVYKRYRPEKVGRCLALRFGTVVSWTDEKLFGVAIFDINLGFTVLEL